jgi:iron complex outermembrane receptor protein
LFDRHTVTIGVETRDNFNQDQGNQTADVPMATYKDHRATFNVGVYGQAEVALLTNLLLNAGVRYDHFETFGGTVNPRIGLIYNPIQRTTLKALFGTAFKAPNAYELYYSGPNNKGNADLEPETIKTYELILEQGITTNITFLTSAFYYQIDHLINQTTDPTDGLLVYSNTEQASAKGLEFELNGRLPKGIRGRASYTYQQTEDALTGQELSNSPRHLAKFNLAVPIWKEKVYSSFEVLYTSQAKTLSGNYARGHWVANMTLFSHDIVKNLELSASVYNLFDTQYSHPGAGEHLQDTILQDGRTFRVKLTYRF